MKYRRLLTVLLLLAVFAAPLRGLGESGGALALPDGLRVIEEEAFAGSESVERVILPEGLREILARAFAGSGLREINLPDSITFIAEDAFEDTARISITASIDSYAFKWAVAQGYLKYPLALSIDCDTDMAHVGDTAVWTARPGGGSPPYSVTFSLSRNGEPIVDIKPDDPVEVAEPGDLNDEAEPGDASGEPVDDTEPGEAEGAAEAGAHTGWIESGETLAYTAVLDQPGSYVLTARMEDADGDWLEIAADPVDVAEAGRPIVSLTGFEGSLETLGTCTWTASASGGTAPYTYRFELKRDGGSLYTRGLSAKPTLSYTFFEPGAHVLTVQARDARGVESLVLTRALAVAPSDATVTGVVRVYVDVDNRGNIIRTNSSHGHYELQINHSSGTAISFDDRIYKNPVFSYGNGANSQGVVAVFDGDQLLRPRSKLYTFEFSTTADRLQVFLIDMLQSLYLDLASASESSLQKSYNVVNTRFSKYVLSTNNCFTAAASWCSWLGYDELTNILNNSRSYLDYFAYNLLDRFGSTWTYVGSTV